MRSLPYCSGYIHRLSILKNLINLDKDLQRSTAMVRAYISSGLVTQYEYSEHRLAIVSIPGKEREPRVGKQGWHGNFDMEFRLKTRVWVF